MPKTNTLAYYIAELIVNRSKLECFSMLGTYSLLIFGGKAEHSKGRFLALLINIRLG